MNNIIPPILKKYENLLLKTEKKYISITTESVAETLGVNQSKLGGIPYWPKDKEFLKINGKMPILIAQINFQEINEIQELNHFPNKGILQFYYNHESDMFGLSFDNDVPSEIKVIYHENVENEYYLFDEEDKSVLLDFDMQPFQNELKLNFSLKSELLGLSDEVNAKKYQYDLNNISDDESDELCDSFSNSGSKIDGYAYFTQYDPRSLDDDKDWILLLQLDTDDNLMFGDESVANLLNIKEDLINRKFNNVFFNSDCC